MSSPRVDPNTELRALPKLDAWLQEPVLQGLAAPLVTREARGLLAEVRVRVLAGDGPDQGVAHWVASGAATEELLQRCRRALRPRHRRVHNGTGIVLHTGIGRAPLPDGAVQAVTDAARSVVVEVDPDSGDRDQRELGVASLLTAITGAEAALVVNNNAAMTFLTLRVMGYGKEIICSRGELVEIGGGFRMPDVMARAGGTLREVGATNRTHLRDYQQAICEATGVMLKVHPSNFRIEGFAGTPSVEELVALGKETGVPIFEDIGSGYLMDRALPGLEDEPRVVDSVRAGVDVVAFSGDKLLGGPQCGIAVGTKEWITALRADPMYRALRCDKLALAGLEATLRIYRDGDPVAGIPVLNMLSLPAETLEARAHDLCRRIGKGLAAEVVPSESFAGSGANPARPLPSFAVALDAGAFGGADALAAALRQGEMPVFTRRDQGKVLLDLRSLPPACFDEVADAVRAACRPT